MSYLVFRFSPVDSWFFRDSRGFNAGESGYVSSQFPPSAQTLTGAIRHILGEKLGIDWKEYRNGGEVEKKQIIGANSEDTGLLNFYGPYLELEGERLYPAPKFLLMEKKENSEEKAFQLLKPGEKKDLFDLNLHDDIQKEFRLPKIDGEDSEKADKKTLKKTKTIENSWFVEEDFIKILSGKIDNLDKRPLYKTSNLVVEEERVGIGRDNEKGAVSESLIYYIQHLRPAKENFFEVVMEVFFSGDFEGRDELEKSLNGALFSVPLGGEGRLSRVRVERKEGDKKPISVENLDDARGIVLTLLTPAEFRSPEDKLTWTPNWTEYLGSEWKFVSACVDKPILEGGWDYKSNNPKPLVPLVPAGSSYFFEYKGADRVSKEQFEKVLNELENKTLKVGERTSFGYGEIAIGIWK